MFSTFFLDNSFIVKSYGWLGGISVGWYDSFSFFDFWGLGTQDLILTLDTGLSILKSFYVCTMYYADILWHVFGSCILLIKSCLPELDFNKAEINFAFNIHLYQIFPIPRLCSLVSLSERWWLWMVRFSAFCKFKNQTQTPNCINFRVIKIQLKECQHSKHKVQR